MKMVLKRTTSLLLVLILLFVTLSANVCAVDSKVIHGILRNGVISEYTYSDEFFSRDADVYYGDLALMSYHFVMSVMYNLDGAQTGVPSQEVPEAGIELLNNLGYESVEDYGYDTRCTIDGIGCVIGQKNIDEKDETIIALAMRGSGYTWEWGGNFKIGTGLFHEGFSKAKDQAVEYITDFISSRKASFNSNVKLWITGYSRSGAVGNLLASSLDDGTCFLGCDIDRDNVYAYVFEAPSVSRADNTKSEIYGNIFNVINPVDIVPKFVPSDWGFSRYGTDVFLPQEKYTENYDALRAKMEEELQQISGILYYEDFAFYKTKNFNTILYDIINLSSAKSLNPFEEDKSVTLSDFLDGLLSIVATEAIGSVQEYADNYQSFLVKLLSSVITSSSYFINTVDFNELARLAIDYIQKNVVYLFLRPFEFVDSFKQLIAEYLEKHLNVDNVYFPEGITKQEYYDLLGEVDDFLITMIRHPDYSYSAYKYLTDKSPAGDSMCFIPHYQVIELAWLRAVEE